MFKYNTQTLFISTFKNKYIQEVTCCSSIHPCSWKDVDSANFGVFSGSVTEAQTPALSSHVWMEVMGSETPSSLKGSSETEMEIVLLAMKPKGNKRRLFFPYCYFLSMVQGQTNFILSCEKISINSIT